MYNNHSTAANERSRQVQEMYAAKQAREARRDRWLRALVIVSVWSLILATVAATFAPELRAMVAG